MRLPDQLPARTRGTAVRAAVVAVLVAVGVALAVLQPGDSAGRPAAKPRAAVTGASGGVIVALSATSTPTPDPAPAAPAPARHRGGAAYYKRTVAKHVAAAAETGFVPLYKEAARVTGVDWRLIASVHRQETAFSTEPGTYHGLNAFGCCAGPMQFNVTNGPVSTWKRYRDAFRAGNRPKSYPHATSFHPSVYDDFDAIMAAGALLRDSGANGELGGGSWLAAYGYYGHDDFGVTYASQVLGRAIGWKRDGFCLNCGLDAKLVAALDDAYGVAARRELRGEAAKKKHRKKKPSPSKKTKTSEPTTTSRRKTPAAKPPRTTSTATTTPPATTTATPPATTPAPAAPAPTTTSAPTQTTAPPTTTTCTAVEAALGCKTG